MTLHVVEPTEASVPAAAAPAVRCPTEQALELVANKWTVHIIYLLEEHPVLRFRELQRALGTITQKELTKQVRRLERFGLVERTIYAEIPPRVEYRITPLGQTLVAPLKTLAAWTKEHGKTVEANRTAYDAKLAPAAE